MPCVGAESLVGRESNWAQRALRATNSLAGGQNDLGNSTNSMIPALSWAVDCRSSKHCLAGQRSCEGPAGTCSALSWLQDNTLSLAWQGEGQQEWYRSYNYRGILLTTVRKQPQPLGIERTLPRADKQKEWPWKGARPQSYREQSWEYLDKWRDSRSSCTAADIASYKKWSWELPGKQGLEEPLLPSPNKTFPWTMTTSISLMDTIPSSQPAPGKITWYHFCHHVLWVPIATTISKNSRNGHQLLHLHTCCQEDDNHRKTDIMRQQRNRFQIKEQEKNTRKRLNE